MLGSAFQIVPIDIRFGSEHDLSKGPLQRFILQLISSDRVAAVWFSGSVCGDCAPLPRAALDRGLTCLPGSGAVLRQSTPLATKLVHFTVRVFRACMHKSIPVALASPHTAHLWQVPCVRRLCRQLQVHQHCTDYCQDGGSRRQRTRLLASHVSLHPVVRHCTGRQGICSRSCKPHARLLAHEQATRVRQARSYPSGLCRRLSAALVNAIYERFSRPLAVLFGLQ